MRKEGAVDAVEGQFDPELSAWIDRVVAYLVENYEVVASPNNLIVLGRRDATGTVVEWRRADTMEEEVFGNPEVVIPGDLCTEIFERLAKRAHRHVQLAAVYPRTTPDYTLNKRDSRWSVIEGDREGDGYPICHAGDTVMFNIERVRERSGVTQLSLTPSYGNAQRIVGVLADGDPAYVYGKRKMTLLVPCKEGEVRHVFCLVECLDERDTHYHYDVYGITATQAGRETVAGKYRGPLRQSYFPYPVVTEDGAVRWDVLYL